MEQGISPYKFGKASFIYAAIAGLVVWLALILQFGISIPAQIKTGYSLPGAIIQILSFFTIQSNLMVGLSLWALLLKPSNALHKFFLRGYVLGGIGLYIIVVGLVYNIVLRNLWAPEGLLKVTDELLHTINPLLFVIYWLISVARHDKLKWRQSLNWLWFPFLYLVYTLIRGSVTKLYPYPFIDAAKLGYARICINSLVLLVVFLVLGLLLIFITRVFKRNT
jgi:hypothetical protein